MLNPEDIDQQLFRELRRRSPAPPVDVAQRVLTTIQQEGPARSSRLNRWTMAACAALCGVAACLALIAAMAQRSAHQTNDAADLVINTYDVEIESLLR